MTDIATPASPLEAAPIQVFLVRHAAAEPRQEGVPDADRRTTAKGRRRFLRAVGGLARAGVRFDAVQCSPWARAAETAELLAELLDDEGQSTAQPLLAAPPGMDLLAQITAPRTALVGHEPWLSQLLALLVCGADQGHLSAQFELGKGGVAWLVGAPVPGGMALRSLWRPRALRLMRRR